ncbi:PREDICTED: uncharacterized protein LOC105154955 [Acromyrmex echinatior]|uniref:uncharacterized protein LOC105154955 n=1 Tax=Acromyrmex echinatior TaxID=103372 RepID=UPI00058107DB|nr:PREDICTED: uncharacterized protein LOC105154955 [Acromyrmex echinatior]
MLPFWPPNNPDLNLLNYYVWGVVERVTNKFRHLNVTSLRIKDKDAIEATFVGMDSAILQHACERFRLRIEVVIQANEGYNILNNCALQSHLHSSYRSPKCHLHRG